MHRPVSRCSWEAKGVAEKAQNLWKVCILPESSRGNWGHLEWPQLSTGGNLNAYRRQFESRLYTGIQLQTGTPCMTKMCLQVGAKHPLPSMDSRVTAFILGSTPTPYPLSSSPASSDSGQDLHLIASTGIQFTLQTWSQWSESGAKFHPEVRWDDYQHVDLSFTYLTIGKWAQLHIARTISVVGSFIVKAKRQIPSETDSVKCLVLDETNHNFLYPPKHKGTCSISFNKGCSWLIQPYAHIAIGFISFSCHLPILFIYVFFLSDL